MQAAITVPYKKKEIPKEIIGLFEPGAVIFSYVSKFINPEELDPEILENIKVAVSEKIFKTMISGHFGDLNGARELLEKLGIREIYISGEDVIILNDSLRRLSENSLIMLGLSNPPVMGEYDLAKARKILKEVGYLDEELTDDKIKKIVNWRHILMQLKRNKIDKIESLQKLLE